MAKTSKKNVEQIVVFSVEEVEGEDGSVSMEFDTIDEAEAHLRKIRKKPGFGVTAYKIWVSIKVHEEDV